MFHAGEVAQTLTDEIFLDACNVRRDAGCQRVVNIVLAGERECLLLHVEGRGLFNHILTLFDITDAAALLQLAEGQLYGLDVVLLQLALDNRVVVPVDEGILDSLVLNDAHLRVHIVLHIVLVAVQMVGRDVEQHRHIGTEIVHVVELER